MAPIPTARATATALNPTRGDPAATARAALLAEPLDRFGLALLADEARQTSGNVVISPLLFIGSALLYVDQAARVE